MRFFAVPAWMIADGKVPPTPPADALLPTTTASAAVVTEALTRIEYRGWKALDRALELIATNAGAAVYAKSPNDLPALLRTADQLLLVRQREFSESAAVNDARQALADFFREAMARGWPVIVANA